MNSLKVVKPRSTIPLICDLCSFQRVMQMWKV